MNGYVLAWRWLAHAAVGGLIVLCLGSLAARLCRQPVRRARVVVLTLLGGFAVPWLGFLPIAPKWSAGFVMATPRASVPSSGEPRAVPTTAAIELPQGPVAVGRAGLPGTVERPARKVSESGRGTRSWPSWLTAFSWKAFALAAYAAVSAGWAAWWLIGQIQLWLVTRAARPA